MNQRRNVIVMEKVVGCSRCDHTHMNLAFEELDMETPQAFTHWAPCPTNGQPILTMRSAPLEVSAPRRSEFFTEVVKERMRQNAKWGTGSPGIWSLFVVLCEEIGEIARAILKGDVPNLREEMIQTAAVICRMFEHHSGGEGISDSEGQVLRRQARLTGTEQEFFARKIGSPPDYSKLKADRLRPPDHPDTGKCGNHSCDLCYDLEPIR